jgi:hypothetical protein
MNSLNNEILLNRLESFWGFGQYESQYWFVGMEEGGGHEIEEISKRFTTWEKLGSSELIDNYEYHLGITGYGYERFFEGNIKLQSTWKKLIRAYLNIENPNKNYSADDVKKIQANNWGRKTSNNCLLDIFPLPSPSASKWLYNEWSDLEILKDRSTYKNTLKDKRIKALRRRVLLYKPKVVMYYGIGKEYLEIWEEVSGVKFSPKNNFKIFENKSIYLMRKGKTLFAVTYQPSGAWNNQYWNKVGEYIHKHL